MAQAENVVRITLTSGLGQYCGGATTLECEARTVGQLFRTLEERFPDLRPHIEQGLAVAINGEMYQDALLQPIPAGSEVHLLPRIAGG